MSPNTKVPSQGSDWTRLLTDPDMVSHLEELLQTYREVPGQEREAALLRAMRQIKDGADKTRERNEVSLRMDTVARSGDGGSRPSPKEEHTKEIERRETGISQIERKDPTARAVVASSVLGVALPQPQPTDRTPPFEPDLFTPPEPADRRRHQRIKCYVAVEIQVDGSDEPVWGNLANIGRGGCLVETASMVPEGKTLQMAIWVSSGKIWVKGVIISGIASRSAQSHGVRVKFSEIELSEKEHLREFLKFVESTTRKAHRGSAYVAQLKV